MNDPSVFLYSLGQTLAVMALYPEGHPSRERTIDGAYEALDGLIGANGRPVFTFLDGEVVYDVLIQTMDACREQVVRLPDNKSERKPLFFDVSLSVIG